MPRGATRTKVKGCEAFIQFAIPLSLFLVLCVGLPSLIRRQMCVLRTGRQKKNKAEMEHQNPSSAPISSVNKKGNGQKINLNRLLMAHIHTHRRTLGQLPNRQSQQKLREQFTESQKGHLSFLKGRFDFDNYRNGQELDLGSQ